MSRSGEPLKDVSDNLTMQRGESTATVSPASQPSVKAAKPVAKTAATVAPAPLPKRKMRPRTHDMLQDVMEARPPSPEVSAQMYLSALDQTMLIPSALSVLKREEETRLRALNYLKAGTGRTDSRADERTIFGATGGAFLVPPRKMKTAAGSASGSSSAVSAPRSLTLSSSPTGSSSLRPRNAGTQSGRSLIADFTSSSATALSGSAKNSTGRESFEVAVGEDLSAIMFPPNPKSKNKVKAATTTTPDSYDDEFEEDEDEGEESGISPQKDSDKELTAASPITPAMIESTPYIPPTSVSKLRLGDIPAIRSAFACAIKSTRRSQQLSDDGSDSVSARYFPVVGSKSNVKLYAELNPYDELIPKESLQALALDEARAERLKLSAGIRELTAKYEDLKRAMHARGQLVAKLQAQLEQEAANRQAQLEEAVQKARMEAYKECEDATRQELSQARGERDTAVAEVKRALQEIKLLQATIAEQGSTLADTRASLEVQTKLAQQRSADLTKARNEFNQLAEQLQTMELKAAEAETKCKEVRADYDTLKENVQLQVQKEYENGVFKLEEAKRRHEEQVAQLEAEIQKLQAENRDLQAQLELVKTDSLRKLRDVANRNEVQGKKSADEISKLQEKHQAELLAKEAEYAREIELLHSRLKSEQNQASESGKVAQQAWEAEKAKLLQQIARLEAKVAISKLDFGRNDFFEVIMPVASMNITENAQSSDSSSDTVPNARPNDSALATSTPLFTGQSQAASGQLPTIVAADSAEIKLSHRDQAFYDALLDFVIGWPNNKEKVNKELSFFDFFASRGAQSRDRSLFTGKRWETDTDAQPGELTKSSSDLQPYLSSRGELSREDKRDTGVRSIKQSRRLNRSPTSSARRSNPIGVGGGRPEEDDEGIDLSSLRDDEDDVLRDARDADIPAAERGSFSKRSSSRQGMNQQHRRAEDATNQSQQQPSQRSGSTSTSSSAAILPSPTHATESATTTDSLAAVETGLALLIRRFIFAFMQENPPPALPPVPVADKSLEKPTVDMAHVPPLQLSVIPNPVSQTSQTTEVTLTQDSTDLITPPSQARSLTRNILTPPSPNPPQTVFSTLQSSNTPPRPAADGAAKVSELTLDPPAQSTEASIPEHLRAVSTIGALPLDSIHLRDRANSIDALSDSNQIETQSSRTESRRSIRSSVSSVGPGAHDRDGIQQKLDMQANMTPQLMQYYVQLASAVQVMVYSIMHTMFRTIGSLPILPPLPLIGSSHDASVTNSYDEAHFVAAQHGPSPQLTATSPTMTPANLAQGTPRRKSNSGMGLGSPGGNSKSLGQHTAHTYSEAWTQRHAAVSRGVLRAIANCSTYFAHELGLYASDNISDELLSQPVQFSPNASASKASEVTPGELPGDDFNYTKVIHSTTMQALSLAPESLVSALGKLHRQEMNAPASFVNDVLGALDQMLITAGSTSMLPILSSKRSSSGLTPVSMSRGLIRSQSHVNAFVTPDGDVVTPSTPGGGNDEPPRRPSYTESRQGQSSLRRGTLRVSADRAGASASKALSAARSKFISALNLLLDCVRAEERSKVIQLIQQQAHAQQSASGRFGNGADMLYAALAYAQGGRGSDIAEEASTTMSTPSATPSSKPRDRLKRAINHVRAAVGMGSNSNNNVLSASGAFEETRFSSTQPIQSETPGSGKRRLSSHGSFDATTPRQVAGRSKDDASANVDTLSGSSKYGQHAGSNMEPVSAGVGVDPSPVFAPALRTVDSPILMALAKADNLIPEVTSIGATATSGTAASGTAATATAQSGLENSGSVTSSFKLRANIQSALGSGSGARKSALSTKDKEKDKDKDKDKPKEKSKDGSAGTTPGSTRESIAIGSLRNGSSGILSTRAKAAVSSLSQKPNRMSQAKPSGLGSITAGRATLTSKDATNSARGAVEVAPASSAAATAAAPTSLSSSFSGALPMVPDVSAESSNDPQLIDDLFDP